MPVTGHPPQSGRIEARIGLRMMPTSPLSPLSEMNPVREPEPSRSDKSPSRSGAFGWSSSPSEPSYRVITAAASSSISQASGPRDERGAQQNLPERELIH